MWCFFLIDCFFFWSRDPDPGGREQSSCTAKQSKTEDETREREKRKAKEEEKRNEKGEEIAMYGVTKRRGWARALYHLSTQSQKVSFVRVLGSAYDLEHHHAADLS